MNMKKVFIGILAATIILSGCGTSQMAAGDPNAVLAGAAIGSNVGGAIGGLIGDSNGGWRGGYRGSAIGTIIGTIAGAAIANAATDPPKAGGVQLPDRKDTALSPAIRKTAASIGHRPLEDTEYTFH